LEVGVFEGGRSGSAEFSRRMGISEDGEDELPCMIGESEGDCIWRGLRRLWGVHSYRHQHIEKSD